MLKTKENLTVVKDNLIELKILFQSNLQNKISIPINKVDMKNESVK
jgi:hypothetical protein